MVPQTKILILAGGSGKEIEPLTRGEPKAFLKIIGRSVISHVVSRIVASGYREVYVVSDRPDNMERELREYRRISRIEVIEQKGRGVEAALLSARGRLKLEPGEKFLLVYGDILVPPSAYITTHMASLEEGFTGAMLAVPETPLPSHGVVEIDEWGAVISVKQASRAGGEGTEARYISGGIYALDQRIFELVEELGDIVAAYNRVAKSGRVKAIFWGHYWVNIGSPWDLLAACYHILSELDRSYISTRASIARSAVIEGPVVVEDEATIDHNSVLKGPLYIGREAFIGVNTFIRNATSVEEGAIIGSYTEINRSIVMDKATIGRGSYISYSVIGERAVVEPNTITWNIAAQPERKGLAKGREYSKVGCVVGKGSRVKAGTIINPGEVIA